MQIKRFLNAYKLYSDIQHTHHRIQEERVSLYRRVFPVLPPTVSNFIRMYTQNVWYGTKRCLQE